MMPFFHGLGPDALRVYARAVVDDADEHLASGMLGREFDAALRDSCPWPCGSSGLSMPWSMLFLSRWTRGSLRRSMTVLSSSVSSPWVSSTMRLPSSWDRSRTNRLKRVKVVADGQHADAQGVVAQFVGQAFDFLGDGLAAWRRSVRWRTGSVGPGP